MAQSIKYHNFYLFFFNFSKFSIFFCNLTLIFFSILIYDVPIRLIISHTSFAFFSHSIIAASTRSTYFRMPIIPSSYLLNAVLFSTTLSKSASTARYYLCSIWLTSSTLSNLYLWTTNYLSATWHWLFVVIFQ